jgi:hypothetical protein
LLRFIYFCNGTKYQLGFDKKKRGRFRKIALCLDVFSKPIYMPKLTDVLLTEFSESFIEL